MSGEVRRVFLVDDQPDIRMIGQRALQVGTNWEVTVFDEAAAMLSALDESQPDLILLDVMMPGTDGPTALAELRRRGCRAPVIMMTARVGRRVEEEYRALGANGVIAKPFDPLTLSHEVRKILDDETEAAAPEPSDDEDAELAQLFLQRLEERLVTLRGALDAERRDEAKHVAHALAGSAGSFGFPEVGLIAGTIEHALDEGGSIDWERARKNGRELEALAARLRAEGEG